jgi:phosphoglycolate phosphatase-like HAD superfamily hydrolase
MYSEALAAHLNAYDHLLPPCAEMFDGARELLVELLNSGIPHALVTGKNLGVQS